jgi:glycosyltransferase involved in cell wall biosynthesis
VKKRSLSAFIPIQNVEDIIEDCLESIKWADEIFIVDAFSTDNTINICKRYPNVKMVQHKYENSGAQRIWGMPQVTHDWVFIIDSDERCNEELRSEIQKVLSMDKVGVDGFWVNIKTKFLGKLQHHDRYLGHRGMRLVRKETYKNYVLKRVHSKLVVKNTGRIQSKHAFLIHEPIRDFSTHLNKMIRYAEWAAQDMAEKGIRANPYHFLFRPLGKFFLHYIVKAGFLDGLRGLILCKIAAFSVFLKYYKLYHIQHNDVKN